MFMNTLVKSNSKLSPATERTGQWVLSQKIPTDVVVKVGDASFSLHKFMLIAKSNLLRKLVTESKEADLTMIDLSDIPGGPEMFEKAAKFCYGINFKITVSNAAALRCAAEYLEMTEHYCNGNLAGRIDDFLTQVAFSSLSGTVIVLKSCEDLPMAEEFKIVKRCVDAASAKACKEAIFPSQSPSNWWAHELSLLNVAFFGKVITAMKQRGAIAPTIAIAVIAYAEISLPDLVRDHSGNGIKSSDSGESFTRNRQTDLLESIVKLLPSERSALPINFLCCVLRAAIFLKVSTDCKKELEKRILANLENTTVDDLLIMSFSYDGERLSDLESIRRIISGFVQKENSVAVFNAGDFKELCSVAMQGVAKMVDAYLGEIAIYNELTISKFSGIATLVPKGARKIDDDLYRAIDIYLKAHPNLDDMEREKLCSVMDPLKLSYEARLHASQNKRLPVRIVLQALYYDQLKLRSGTEGGDMNNSMKARNQVLADLSLVKENESLRTELMMMKMHLSDMQKNQGTTSSKGGSRKPTFFSSMTKTLGKLNPFRQGSKDTSNIRDVVDVTKPRRRRFSIS